MRTVEETIYVFKRIRNTDWLPEFVTSSSRLDECDSYRGEIVLVHTEQVSISFEDVSLVDATAKAINALEIQVEGLMDSTQERVKNLQEQIESLRVLPETQSSL